MKKLFIIVAIVLATATTITVVSCKKDKENEKSNVSFSKESSIQENMDEYLLSFKQKLQNATKDGETISFEQARLVLSDLLNFDFGDANNATDVFVNDTVYVKLQLTNNTVNLSNLAKTYNEAIDRILASYRILDLPEKSVYSIICKYDDNGAKDGNTQEIIIEVTYRGYLGDRNYTPHDTLSWDPRRVGGSCDDHSITYGGACDMELWLNDAIPTPNCLDGGRVYFTEQGEWFQHGNNTYNPIVGRYEIFTIFTNRIDTVCIPHEDMEYYFSNILDYVYQGTISTHVVTDIEVDCPCIPFTPESGYPGDCHYWRIHIKHAKANCTGTGPISQ